MPCSTAITPLPLLALLTTLIASAACAQPPALSPEAREQKVSAMYQGYVHDFPKVQSLTVEELDELMLDNKVTLVDVRPKIERDISMIPGAITSEELEANLDQYRDTKIVAYCTIGYRSGVYAKELHAKGIEILNLEGSLLAWTHAGKPLVNQEGPTNKLHVYGKRWNLAADGYEAVW